MRGFRQGNKKAAETAAKAAMKDVCRVSFFPADCPSLTLFVNARTLRPLPVRQWPGVNTLMYKYPQKWRVPAVVVTKEWDGENWEPYDMTPCMDGVVEKFLLRTIIPYLNQAGQEIVRSKVAERYVGHGSIIAAFGIPDKVQRRLFELVLECGKTAEELI